MNKEEFIKRAKEVHGEKYDYSEVNYINCKIKVKIICPIHGEFLQTPDCHINGKCGCCKCGKERASLKLKYWTKERIILEAQKYKTQVEFKQSVGSGYSAAQRIGIIKELQKYWASNRHSRNYWQYETCYALAEQCRTRSEMKQESNSAYNVALKQGWLKDYTWMKIRFKKPKGYWNNYDRCKKEAKKYSTISEFEKKCSGASKYCRQNNWLNDFFKKKRMSNGYWNNYDRCKNLSEQCKNISEFVKRSSSAYFYSRKNKWLESFNWLADTRIYNNKVDCVYVYEFEKHKTCYVGRTLMRRIEKRDKEHRTSLYKDKKGTHLTRDGVFLFSLLKSCSIPQIKILESNLTIEEGKTKENEWVNYYKNNGWILLNKAKTGKISSSIGSLGKNKWNYEKCYKIAKDCNSLSELKQKNSGCYEFARVHGWLKDYTWFIKTSELLSKALKNKHKIWTRERCYNLAKTCKTRSEFLSKSSRAYAVSKEHGWLIDYSWFVSGFSLRRPYKWTEEKCKKIALTCNTKSELKQKNSSAYFSAKKKTIG